MCRLLLGSTHNGFTAMESVYKATYRGVRIAPSILLKHQNRVVRIHTDRTVWLVFYATVLRLIE